MREEISFSSRWALGIIVCYITRRSTLIIHLQGRGIKVAQKKKKVDGFLCHIGIYVIS